MLVNNSNPIRSFKILKIRNKKYWQISQKKKKKKKKTLQSNPKVIENPLPEFKSALCISIIWNCKAWSKTCNNGEVIDMIILLNSIEWPKKLVLNKSKTCRKITSEIIMGLLLLTPVAFLAWFSICFWIPNTDALQPSIQQRFTDFPYSWRKEEGAFCQQQRVNAFPATVPLI